MLLKRPLLVLFLLTFIVYFSSLFNQFVWDDEQFIYRNQYVRSFDVQKIFTTNTIAGAGELSNYYRPLTTLSFAIDYQFWQLNPFGYHLGNTILHAGTGCLLFLLLKKLQFEKRLTFFVALVFLLHPLQTEAVTYANSRGDSLYSFFLMSSLLLHALLYNFKAKRLSLYNLSFSLNSTVLAVISVAAYSASILSKEIALAGLGLHGLVILRHFFLEIDLRKKILPSIFSFIKKHKKSFLTFGGSLLVVICYLFLRATALNFQNTFNFYDDTSLYSENVWVRLLTFSKIIFIYIRLILIPFPLHMERDTTLVTSFFNLWPFAAITLIGVLGYLGFREWRKHSKTTILFGLVWFAVMIVPVSGIIAINGLLYEHWLYLPLIGASITLYGLVNQFFPSFISSTVAARMVFILCMLYAILVIRQNYFWSSPITLYTHLLKHTDSARIHNNLAMAYSETGQYDEAITEYNLALQYGQPYPQIYHNLANTYRAMGELENAEKNYEQALELSPGFFHSYSNLIDVYIQQKKYEKAIAISQLAQIEYPQTPDYHLYELELYIISDNVQSFETKKTWILEEYANDDRIEAIVKNLRFPHDS